MMENNATNDEELESNISGFYAFNGAEVEKYQRQIVKTDGGFISRWLKF